MKSIGCTRFKTDYIGGRYSLRIPNSTFTGGNFDSVEEVLERVKFIEEAFQGS